MKSLLFSLFIVIPVKYIKYLMFMWPCIVLNLLVIKPTRCTNFSILFLEWNCMFRTVPVSIIRSFSLYTQQWYMSYRYADSLRAGSGWNSLQLLSGTFITLRRTERDMIIKICRSSCKVPLLLLSDCNVTWISLSLLSHRAACCHTCYTIQLMHYSHFKTQSLQHLKPIKC